MLVYTTSNRIVAGIDAKQTILIILLEPRRLTAKNMAMHVANMLNET